jgi:hypothetical protein
MRNLKNLLMLFCAVTAVASASIEFSPGGTTPGQWSYDGVDTFTFSQSVEIDTVKGTTSDSLFGKQVYLPSMTLLSYATSPIPGFGAGTLAGGGVVEIKDGSTVLVSGTLSGGTFYAAFAGSLLYPEITTDILITYVDNSIASSYLSDLKAGMYFDLALSLQSTVNFDTMISNNMQGSNGFSGSMTSIIPEPATMILLGLGALLTRKF